jgi:glycosyltransferase 2 family protein
VAEDTREEAFGGGVGRRRVLLVVAAAIVLVVGAGTAIGKAANYARLLHELRGAEAEWLPLCLLGEVLAYAGYLVAYRETAAVDGGPRLPVLRTLRIVAAGFGAMVLATGAGTLAVDYWALRRAGSSARDALARVIALNTLEWGVLGGAATAAAATLALGVDGGAPWAAILPWLVVVPLCVAAALWVSADSRHERLSAPRDGRVRRLFGTAVRGVRLVRLLVSDRAWRRGLGVAGAAVYWAGDLLCLWAGLRAFGVQLGLAALVFAYATGYLVAALPLPAGGAGGVDAAMTYALTLVGVPLAPALLGAFAYRLFNFWLPVLPALAVIPSMRRVARDVVAVN